MTDPNEGARAPIQIHLEDLLMALATNTRGEGSFYLDKETGKVLLYSDGMLNDEIFDDLDEEEEEIDIEDYLAQDRFEEIPSFSSSDSYRIMEAFVEILPKGPERRELENALEGRKPFRRFKDALDGGTRERWFTFEHRANKKRAREWLDSIGVDAILIDLRPQEPEPEIPQSPSVIFLNGTSSAGKSTLAKALQAALSRPYLHFCIDAFEEMLPPVREGQPEFATTPMLTKMLAGMHGSLAAMVEAGNNLIVDHLLIENSEPSNWVYDCVSRLTDYDVLMVGVHCSPEETDRREQARGDRRIGLAAWQREHMHQRVSYDVEVDTSTESTEESVGKILKALNGDDRYGRFYTLKNYS